MNSKKRRQQQKMVDNNYVAERWISIERTLDITTGLLLIIAALTLPLRLAMLIQQPDPFFYEWHVGTYALSAFGAGAVGLWRIFCGVRIKKRLRRYLRPVKILRRNTFWAVGGIVFCIAVFFVDNRSIYNIIMMVVCAIFAIRYWWRANNIQWIRSLKRG